MNHLLNLQKNNKIYIFKETGSYSLFFEKGNGNTIVMNEKNYSTGCLNCRKAKCMEFENAEISCEKFSTISPYVSNKVCPSNALMRSNNKIEINEEKCIGCGLCVSRCPFGAISIKNNIATVAIHNVEIMDELDESDDNIILQKECFKKMILLKKEGCICDENRSKLLLIEKISEALPTQLTQSLFVRSLLIQLNNRTQITRIGNVFQRMDGVFENDDSYGVIEIKTGTDYLGILRDLLDDIAILSYRYRFDKLNIIPLHICDKIPNKRSEYWQTINDINKICGIKIYTISINALLVLMWNFASLTDMSKYYFDSENINKSTIKSIVESEIKRELQLGKTATGKFESGK